MMWVEKMTVLPLSRHSRMKRYGARGHDIEAVGGFVEDHRADRGEGAGNEVFCFMPVDEFVAAAVAEAVHVQTIEDVIDTLFQRGFV